MFVCVERHRFKHCAGQTGCYIMLIMYLISSDGNTPALVSAVPTSDLESVVLTQPLKLKH